MAISFISKILLLAFMAKSEICYISPKEKVELKKLDEKINKVTTEFALKPVIREESEKMLSLLIKAKSPMITNWVKTRNIDPIKNPEKVALEWDKYYAKSFIINRYPTGKKEIDLEIEKSFEILVRENINENLKNKYDKFLVDTKSQAKKIIESYPISAEDKKILTQKVNSIKIYFPNDLPSSKYIKSPLEFVDWSLAYDPQNNEINVGINALRYNDQSLKAALLHEIAHSFDSCRWSQENHTPWPFEKIGLCLRQFAKTRDDSKLDLMFQTRKISEQDFQKMKQNPTCNNSAYPPIGTQADQLPETFADWFSAEALDNTQINKEFRNDLCEDRALNVGSSYLTNKERLFKIYLANKGIQKSLKEKSDTQTCKF